jgi:hypothetical protein
VLSGETLSPLLSAIATGHPDRAGNIVDVSDELAADERARLRPIVDGAGDPAGQIRRLGDALRGLGADPALPDRCYRVASYLDEHAAVLTRLLATGEGATGSKREPGDDLFWAEFERQRLASELARAESDLRVVENDLRQCQRQVRDMRRTVSWRVTAPLRVVRRLLPRR